MFFAFIDNITFWLLSGQLRSDNILLGHSTRADTATILGASESAMHLLRRSGRVGVLDLPDLRIRCAHLRGGRHGFRDS